MTDIEAMDIVLDLALQNVVSEEDNPDQHNRQMQAMSIVEKILDEHR